jgi:DNA-binding IclR family transcriptional regulator
VAEVGIQGESELPEDARTLLRTSVNTYERLAVLQLLEQEAPRPWTVRELSERLQLGAQLVEDALNALHVCGLVGTPAATEGSVYSPADPATRMAAERLLRVYRDQPHRIIHLLSGYAIERVRTAALRAFADAFVIGKGKDKDDG